MKNKTPPVIVKIGPESSGSMVVLDGWVTIEEAARIRCAIFGNRTYVSNMMNCMKGAAMDGFFRSLMVHGKLFIYREDVSKPNVFVPPLVIDPKGY